MRPGFVAISWRRVRDADFGIRSARGNPAAVPRTSLVRPKRANEDCVGPTGAGAHHGDGRWPCGVNFEIGLLIHSAATDVGRSASACGLHPRQARRRRGYRRRDNRRWRARRVPESSRRPGRAPVLRRCRRRAELLARAGKRKSVRGQDDQLIDIALKFRREAASAWSTCVDVHGLVVKTFPAHRPRWEEGLGVPVPSHREHSESFDQSGEPKFMTSGCSPTRVPLSSPAMSARSPADSSKAKTSMF
ncbi:hypothetical protein ABH922_000225 [Rhodococcus sp. 27YEA15]